jgi:hypothetical protein
MTWSIVTDEGAPMFREDLFTDETEAYEYLRLCPLTASGKRQYVASTEVIEALKIRTREIRAEYEAALRAALVAATQEALLEAQ